MRKISFDAQYSAMGRMFCREPSTLLPWVMTTRRVSGRMAFLTAGRVDAVIGERENGEGEPPFAFKRMQGAEYGVVLQFCRDCVELRFLVFHKPVDEQV